MLKMMSGNCRNFAGGRRAAAYIWRACAQNNTEVVCHLRAANGGICAKMGFQTGEQPTV